MCHGSSFYVEDVPGKHDLAQAGEGDYRKCFVDLHPLELVYGPSGAL